MANFLWDNLPTIATKFDSAPLAIGVDTTRFVQASDINSLVSYITDIRTVLGGKSPTLLTGSAAATGGVAIAIDNAVAQTTGNILSLRTGGVEKAQIDATGSMYSDIIFSYNTGSSNKLSLLGRAADSGSSVAVILGSSNAFNTAGGKLISVQNNAVEKAYVDQAGLGVFTGVQSTAGLRLNRRSISDTNTTAVNSDLIIGYSTLTAARVITVSGAGTAPSGHYLIIKDESGSATGVITLSVTPSTGLIDGLSTKVVVNAAYGSARIYFNGTNWYTI
jgi:hypothetical protein